MLGDDLASFKTDRNTQAICATLRIVPPQILEGEVVDHIFLIELPNIIWPFETFLVSTEGKQ